MATAIAKKPNIKKTFVYIYLNLNNRTHEMQVQDLYCDPIYTEPSIWDKPINCQTKEDFADNILQDQMQDVLKPPTEHVKPVNIVSTFSVGIRLCLKKIAMSARNSNYNKKRMPAVTMRIKEPKTTALIFESGKVVVTAAKSVDESRLAGRKFARIIQKVGFPEAKFCEFTIRNIVASHAFGFSLNLNKFKFMVENYIQISYEPEIFPGAIIRLIDIKVTVLLFSSGKMIMTGANTMKKTEEALLYMKTVVEGNRQSIEFFNSL